MLTNSVEASSLDRWGGYTGVEEKREVSGKGRGGRSDEKKEYAESGRKRESGKGEGTEGEEKHMTRIDT